MTFYKHDSIDQLIAINYQTRYPNFLKNYQLVDNFRFKCDFRAL